VVDNATFAGVQLREPEKCGRLSIHSVPGQSYTVMTPQLSEHGSIHRIVAVEMRSLLFDDEGKDAM
jgi:hypothetical protein